MEHQHEWQSAFGHFGRYICECGASGYRAAHGENRNKIVPHKTRLDLSATPRQRIHVGNPNMGEGNAHRGKSGPGA